MGSIKTYRFDASSTMNMTLYKPMNGAAGGTFTVERGTAKIKSIRLEGEAMLRDSNNADYSTDVILTALINPPSNAFANSSYGITFTCKNSEEFQYNRELTAGSYTVLATASPVLFRNPNHTEAAPVTWTHTTVSWTLIVELEEISPPRR